MKTAAVILSIALATCFMLPGDASAGAPSGGRSAGAAHVGGGGARRGGYGGYGGNRGYYGGGFYPGFGLGLGLGLGYGYGYGYGYPLYSDYFYASPLYPSPLYPSVVVPSVFPDPYLSQSSPYPGQAPIAPQAGPLPPPPAMPTAGTVRMEVILPDPQARVWVDGQPTVSTGTDRVYVTSPLDLGYTYSYTLRATWNQGGREVTTERQVDVEPGQATRIDFTREIIQNTPNFPPPAP